jgi:hypothetical protein
MSATLISGYLLAGGLTAAEWIDWAKMKVAEIDGETA